MVNSAATSAFGHTLVNLGPLTTTYTPPASCATGTNSVFLGLKTAPERIIWMDNCADNLGTHTLGDCYPSGTAVDAGAQAAQTRLDSVFLAYHQPGYFCPAGWTTAGVAAKA